MFVLKILKSFAPAIDCVRNLQVQLIPEVKAKIKSKYLSQSIDKS